MFPFTKHLLQILSPSNVGGEEMFHRVEVCIEELAGVVELEGMRLGVMWVFCLTIELAT